jgi:hypothetical protein
MATLSITLDGVIKVYIMLNRKLGPGAEEVTRGMKKRIKLQEA